MRRIDSATRLCAVIGNPVEHSLSPCLHNAAFEASGLNCVYLAFRVEDVAACLAGMRALPTFRGLSVTIPHKLAVMRHLDAIDPMARHIGSVNTIVHEGGQLIGSSTDGPGTLRAFQEAGVSFEGQRVLFVGGGGAVRAVAFAIAGMTGARAITIIGRSPERIAPLVADLQAKVGVPVEAKHLGEDLEQALAEHEIVINGTPIGMHPHPENSPIPRAWLRPGQVVFDMVYRPHRTRLIREAEERGCITILGVEMLLHQAVLQFEAWMGVPAPVQAMREAVLAELHREPPATAP